MRTRWSRLEIGKQPFALAARIVDESLREHFLPYWYRTCDGARGGYTLDDRHRTVAEKTLRLMRRKIMRPLVDKIIVSQARLVYVFSLAHRLGYGTAQRNYLQAADQGYRFLMDRMYDHRKGGFFWSVDADGKQRDRRKFLYGQSMAIYALVEYHRASGLAEPLEIARQIFTLANTLLHDDQNLGWFEHAAEDWEPLLSSNEEPFRAVDVIGLKSSDGHLHWMEALTELHQATKDSVVRTSLEQVLNLNCKFFFPRDPADGCPFRAMDWKPVTGLRFDGVSYGHQVEFAWLMIRAQQALDVGPDWEYFDGLLLNALEFGFDQKRGGFYDRGTPNQPAQAMEKTWWVQAEGLAALGDAVQHCSRPEYSAALARLLDWIFKYQVCDDGIWIWSTDAVGRPINRTKAVAKKAGYHEMRAMTKFVHAFAS